MSELYNRISDLCSRKGITTGKMCTDLGISRGLLTDLKMGRKQTYSPVTLQKIADYFDVSVDYLLNGVQEKVTDDLLMHGLLDGDTEGFTYEMLEEVKRFAKYVKNRGTF